MSLSHIGAFPQTPVLSLNTWLWTNIVYFCFWLIPCSLCAQECKFAGTGWMRELPAFPVPAGNQHWRKCACDTLQCNLCPFVRSQLKPYTLFKGFPQDRGVAVHCYQQKGRFLLFLLSSLNHSRLTVGISYRLWKSDEHWGYLSGNFSWSQIFVKLQLPRLKAEPKLAGAWLRNSIYFIWFETM